MTTAAASQRQQQSMSTTTKVNNTKQHTPPPAEMATIPDVPLIVTRRVDVPRKYRHWTVDYDKSTSVQSYNQLKSSAKYIFSKFKSPATTTAPVSTSELDADPAISMTLSTDAVTLLGNHGEVYYIDNKHTRIHMYDWFPKNTIRVSASGYGTSLNDKSLYLIDSNRQTQQELVSRLSYPLNEYKNYRCPNYLAINQSNSQLQVVHQGRTWNLRFQFDPASEYVPVTVDSFRYLVIFDKTKSKIHVFDYTNFELVDSYDVLVSNSNPIFDLKDSILMYVPKSSKQIDRKKLSPVNLSSKKNLLNKLIKTFSNTVMDSMFMFSEITQQKIKHILDDKEPVVASECVNDENLKENYIDIFTEVYNTISKNSDFINAINLTTKKSIFQMSLPSGCSKISISPYDLQFLTASTRGDEIFLWDYTKADISIVLMDKYIRGKTSAIIEQLEWGTGNQSIFCLSRQNGSLHYFVNESLRNYEDLSIRKTEKKTRSGSAGNAITATSDKNTLNSWCLSNLKLKSFKIVRPLYIKDFIVAVDASGDLLTIDIESGCIDGYLQIDIKEALVCSDLKSESECEMTVSAELLNPEIEVETCKPFLPAYNNRKYKFTEIAASSDMDGLTDVFGDLNAHLRDVKSYEIAGTLFDKKVREKQDKYEHEQDKQIAGDTPSPVSDSVTVVVTPPSSPLDMSLEPVLACAQTSSSPVASTVVC